MIKNKYRTSAAFCLSLTFAFSPSSHAEEAQADAGITYAPQQKIIQGTKTLTCVGIKYQDMANYVSSSQCKSVGRQVSDFYDRNSRGLLKIQSKGYGLSVPLNGNQKNYMTAVKLAKAKYPGANMYAITGNFSTSHAGGGVAFLRGALYRDAEHEVGHLLGLGHAGSYKSDNNGKVSLDAYGDGSSVMGRFPSAYLTAPQYYSRGWLPKTEAAVYEPGKIYDLKKITDFTGAGLSTVIISPTFFKKSEASSEGATSISEQRQAFVSFPRDCYGGEKCAVLHLAIANGAGSQRVKVFGSEYYDEQFTGLHVKIVGFENNKISISIDTNPKPAGFVGADSYIEQAAENDPEMNDSTLLSSLGNNDEDSFDSTGNDDSDDWSADVSAK